MSVFVTGIGVISALGNTVDENFSALVEKKHGICKTTIEGLKNEVLLASVKLSNQELKTRCKHPVSEGSRTSLLGILAAEECWGANVPLPSLRTGLISGTSVGGMDISEHFFRNYLASKEIDFSPMQYHDSGSTTEAIANHLGVCDYVSTISTACSSGSNAIMHGARLIQAGIVDRVLVGGTDALTQFTISGFTSLMIYNEEICKPFDNHRNGLNLGEGAAFLLLEGEKSLSITKNKVLGTVLGWANTADAFHQTATSPDAIGAVSAMTKALEKATLKPEQIGYINAHGTGTKNNDLTESVALKTVFGERVPPFSSTKSYTGHTLAASGAIEAIFSILSLQHQVLFPNLHFNEVIPETALTPITVVQQVQKLDYVLSNSFGFGGNCTALIFGKD